MAEKVGTFTNTIYLLNDHTTSSCDKEHSLAISHFTISIKL